MKKFLSIMLCALMLAGSLAVTAFATVNVELSMTEAIQAAPGDEITVDVNIDSNSGIVSASLFLNYDVNYFSLQSVSNGDVFADEDALYTEKDSGTVTYMAIEGADANLTATGKLFSVTLKVLKTAYNGEHTISIEHRDAAKTGNGWFIDFNNQDDDVNIPIKNSTTVTVSGSTVDPEDTVINEETAAPETAAPETDASGETVKTPDAITTPSDNSQTNAAGEGTAAPETTLGAPVKPAETEADKEYVTEYETDADGKEVIGSDGKPSIVYREIIEENDDKIPTNTVIIIVCICAVVAAAVIVAVVMLRKKKTDKK